MNTVIGQDNAGGHWRKEICPSYVLQLPTGQLGIPKL
uniref:Uncharacterized protein n=1 Tax=Anguilla anguilla TaxID=7936 RepID=A0A0E9PJC9_ANGAN